MRKICRILHHMVSTVSISLHLHFNSSLPTNYLKSNFTAKPLITLPVVNEVVIAKYVDNVFYKAIVKEVDGENVKVFYTAYGNSDIVKLSDIKSISNVLKNVNMFIWKVALADVPDLPLTAPVSSLMNGIINSSPAIEFTMVRKENFSLQKILIIKHL